MEEALYQAIESGTRVVTAHRRQAHQIRYRYATAKQAAQVQAWETPAISGWDDWLADLHREVLWSGYSAPRTQRKLISPFQEHVLWERILAGAADVPIDDLAGTARQAADAWRLLQAWRLPDPGTVPRPSRDVRAFALWMRRYYSRCREQSLIDRARVADAVAPALRAGAVPPPGSMLLVGFDGFTPQQRLLLKTLEELGTRLDRYRAPPLKAQARRVVLPDAEAEFDAAARWVRVILSNDTVGNTAVLVPGLASHRRQIERIFDDVLMPGSSLPGASDGGRPYNVAAGQRFHRYPLVAAALTLCALTLQSMRFDRFSSLLRGPFSRAAQAEQPLRARFEMWLREHNVARVPVERIGALLQRFAREAGEAADESVTEAVFASLVPILARAGGELRASQWAELYKSLLGACGWPGDQPLQSAEYQTAERWRALLDELGGLDFLTAPMRAADAHALLTRLARQVVFQPQTPDLAVQILPPEQARGLRFDHLWICGWHANAWPAPASPNPFVPLAWQREHKMPGASADVQLEAADRLTRRLLRAAPDIMISSPAAVDDVEVAVSSLVEHLPEVTADTLALADVTDYREAIRTGTDLERFDDRIGPPLESYERQDRTPGGSRLFALQAACPFRAFAELRLGAPPLPEPAPGLTPLERGRLVHAALERVWQRLLGSDVLRELVNSEYLEVQAWEMTDKALAVEEHRRVLPLAQRFRDMEHQRLVRLVVEWLRLEAQRPGFDVVHAETETDLPVGDLRVSLKMDRVDRLAGGGLAVIDYKTGKPTVSQWFGPRPDEPQLPLYALAQKEPVAAVAFALIRPNESAFVGLAREDGLLPGVMAFDRHRSAKHAATDWQALIEGWRESLTALAGDYAAGRAEVDPKSGACRHCHLGPLCRVGEQAGLDAVLVGEANGD